MAVVTVGVSAVQEQRDDSAGCKDGCWPSPAGGEACTCMQETQSVPNRKKVWTVVPRGRMGEAVVAVRWGPAASRGEGLRVPSCYSSRGSRWGGGPGFAIEVSRVAVRAREAEPNRSNIVACVVCAASRQVLGRTVMRMKATCP